MVQGNLGPSAEPYDTRAGLNHGTIMWSVTEGEGAFSGATGLITSNFTFSEQGDIVDNHYVRLFTP